MDDLDLEILGKCLPGDQQFNLKGSSDEEAEAFNEWGDRLLALRDRGFLEIPEGLIQRNHQGGASRYHRIGVRRVTADGRRELKRYEPPDFDTVEIIRAKIEQDIADQRRAFGNRFGELTFGSSGHGGPHSSTMMKAVDGLIEDEYRKRGRLLVDGWRGVIAAQGLLLTKPVAQMMKDDLWRVLDEHSMDIRDAFLGSPAPRGNERTQAELSNLRQAALRRIESEIDYAALTALTQAPPPPATQSEGGATHHNIFNLTSSHLRVNIGSEDHSQNVVNITPPQLFAELRKAFEAQVADIEERQRLLTRLEALEQGHNSPSFGQRYIDFMAAAANHATVVAPYLPALAQLFHPG